MTKIKLRGGGWGICQCPPPLVPRLPSVFEMGMLCRFRIYTVFIASYRDLMSILHCNDRTHLFMGAGGQFRENRDGLSFLYNPTR